MMELMFKFSPFLEMIGADSVRNMTRPGAIRTHLSYGVIPYSERAKYVVVARNPYDCCVSYYYHLKNFPGYEFENGTFDEFFDAFVEGNLGYGDFFDHLLSWYDHRNDPNVFFITYEDLKMDTRTWILKLAYFIGEEYGRKLRDHPDALESIMRKCSLRTMREVNAEAKTIGEALNISSAEDITEGLQNFGETQGDPLGQPMAVNFVRKGVVGDWHNHFSKEQVERIKERIAFKTKDSSVMDVWKEVGLP